jgi:PBP1b-binding outer membrane lipoprotein LpoB
VKTKIFGVLVATAFLLAACSDDETRRVEREQKGREETRSIRHTEAVGYSGDAIADKVDSALDKSEERDARMRQEVEEQAQ